MRASPIGRQERPAFPAARPVALCRDPIDSGMAQGARDPRFARMSRHWMLLRTEHPPSVRQAEMSAVADFLRQMSHGEFFVFGHHQSIHLHLNQL